MAKILHIVKQGDGKFQVRKSSGSGEGAGAGEHLECRDQKHLESALRAEGCDEGALGRILEELKESDNAEFQF